MLFSMNLDVSKHCFEKWKQHKILFHQNLSKSIGHSFDWIILVSICLFLNAMHFYFTVTIDNGIIAIWWSRLAFKAPIIAFKKLPLHQSCSLIVFIRFRWNIPGNCAKFTQISKIDSFQTLRQFFFCFYT